MLVNWVLLLINSLLAMVYYISEGMRSLYGSSTKNLTPLLMLPTTRVRNTYNMVVYIALLLTNSSLAWIYYISVGMQVLASFLIQKPINPINQLNIWGAIHQ
jgi:hypothetical protein